jgi:hypothetical protein
MPSVFGRNLRCEPVTDTREKYHWSHACSLQRRDGIPLGCPILYKKPCTAHLLGWLCLHPHSYTPRRYPVSNVSTIRCVLTFTESGDVASGSVNVHEARFQTGIWVQGGCGILRNFDFEANMRTIRSQASLVCVSLTVGCGPIVSRPFWFVYHTYGYTRICCHTTEDLDVCTLVARAGQSGLMARLHVSMRWIGEVLHVRRSRFELNSALEVRTE